MRHSPRHSATTTYWPKPKGIMMHLDSKKPRVKETARRRRWVRVTYLPRHWVTKKPTAKVKLKPRLKDLGKPKG